MVLSSVGWDEWGTEHRVARCVSMVSCTTALGVALVLYCGHGVVWGVRASLVEVQLCVVHVGLVWC